MKMEKKKIHAMLLDSPVASTDECSADVDLSSGFISFYGFSHGKQIRSWICKCSRMFCKYSWYYGEDLRRWLPNMFSSPAETSHMRLFNRDRD